MSHRRICYCCGCEYFSDKFGRDELGRYWDEVSGNWELAGGGVQTESSNAVLKCLKEHPNQFTTYLVSATVTFTAYGDVAKLIADYDGAQKEGVFKIISDGHGLIETYDNGDLVAWANAGDWRLNEPITINLCLSKTEVRANGIGEAIQNEATSSVVALGTGEVTGTVTFDDVSISKHDDDNPGCAKCRATIPSSCACQEGYPPDEPSHVPAQVTVTLDWSDLIAAVHPYPISIYHECVLAYLNDETYTLTPGGIYGAHYIRSITSDSRSQLIPENGIYRAHYLGECMYTYRFGAPAAPSLCGEIVGFYCSLGRYRIELGGFGYRQGGSQAGSYCRMPWFYSPLDGIDCLGLSIDLVGMAPDEMSAVGIDDFSQICFTTLWASVTYNNVRVRAKCHVEAG